MGSEGAFGVVTSVTVRVRRVPAVKVYETWRFASFDEGAAAMRTLAQGGALPTVLRLSDEAETMVNLAEPGRGRRRVRRRLPDGGRLRGRAGRRRRAARRDDRRCSTGLGGTRSRRGRWRRPGPRAASTAPTCATRCSTSACSSRPSRRSRSGPTSASDVRRGQAGAGEHTRPRRAAGAGALPHLARLRDRCLAVLHGRDPSGRRPRGPVACGQGRGVRRDDRATAPRSPTTTPSARTTSPGWPRRSAPSGSRCCVR